MGIRLTKSAEFVESAAMRAAPPEDGDRQNLQIAGDAFRLQDCAEGNLW